MISRESYIGISKVLWIRILSFLDEKELAKVASITKGFNKLVSEKRHPPNEFDWDVEDLGETIGEEVPPDFAEAIQEIIEEEEKTELQSSSTKLKNFASMTLFEKGQ